MSGINRLLEFLYILGALASIGAAIFSVSQAESAKNSASKAEIYKNELESRRDLVEVSQIHSETTRILGIVARVGPACSKQSTRGINPQSIAEDVQQYTRFLNEHSGHFARFFENEAKKLCSQLDLLVEDLSQTKISDFASVKEKGSTIYRLINGFMPIIKRLKDRNQIKEVDNP